MISESKEGMIFCNKIQNKLENLDIKCKIFDISDIYHIKSDQISILNIMLASLDFFKIGEKLFQIEYRKALKLCKYIISHDLAYCVEFINDKKSEELCNYFFEFF